MESRDPIFCARPVHGDGGGRDAAGGGCAAAHPVDLFLAKFLAFEAMVERERGTHCLFALVGREGAWPDWDLVVSAAWVGRDERGARAYLCERSAAWFRADELARVGPYVALHPSEKFVSSFLARLPRHEPLHEIARTVIDDVEIRRAVVINSCRAA